VRNIPKKENSVTYFLDFSLLFLEKQSPNFEKEIGKVGGGGFWFSVLIRISFANIWKFRQIIDCTISLKEKKKSLE